MSKKAGQQLPLLARCPNSTEKKDAVGGCLFGACLSCLRPLARPNCAEIKKQQCTHSGDMLSMERGTPGKNLINQYRRRGTWKVALHSCKDAIWELINTLFHFIYWFSAKALKVINISNYCILKKQWPTVYGSWFKRGGENKGTGRWKYGNTYFRQVEMNPNKTAILPQVMAAEWGRFSCLWLMRSQWTSWTYSEELDLALCFARNLCQEGHYFPMPRFCNF